jgi:hypothetical protein
MVHRTISFARARNGPHPAHATKFLALMTNAREFVGIIDAARAVLKSLTAGLWPDADQKREKSA